MLFERRAERHRRKRRTHPPDRRIEVVERLFLDLRRDLGPETGEADASCATSARCVFFTDSTTVAVSNGWSVLGSMISTSSPSAASVSAALRLSLTIRPVATIVKFVPGRTMFA